MPVKVDFDFGYSTNTHFTYINSSEIKYPFFSDQIYLGDYIYSIGDVIMSIFGILSLTFFGICLFFDYKTSRLEKDERYKK